MVQSLTSRACRFSFVLCVAVFVAILCLSSSSFAQKVDKAKLDTAARRSGKTPAGPPVPPEVTAFQSALAGLWKQ